MTAVSSIDQYLIWLTFTISHFALFIYFSANRITPAISMSMNRDGGPVMCSEIGSRLHVVMIHYEDAVTESDHFFNFADIISRFVMQKQFNIF